MSGQDDGRPRRIQFSLRTLVISIFCAGAIAAVAIVYFEERQLENDAVSIATALALDYVQANEGAWPSSWADFPSDGPSASVYLQLSWPEDRKRIMELVYFDFDLRAEELASLDHSPHKPIRGRWGLAYPDDEKLTSLAVELRGYAALKKMNQESGEPPVAERLRAALRDEIDRSLLEVEYNDLYWRGGRKIRLNGSGELTIHDTDKGMDYATFLSKEKTDQVLRLTVGIEGWQQRIPEREAVPDESRCVFCIKYQTDQSKIWEWYSDLNKVNRIVRFTKLIDAFLKSPELQFQKTPILKP